ncbi:fatty acyl-CoA reductase 1 [Anthonomus grandis grandis]|uniref:fatty acyl-CoA reductase 1 n=1 Tax=Anthonomus grandis grandis TaxID=2921223 RepID=UPI002166B6B8|nr:fatty acyl-CoA reductase 1 [Anthonomus grandis grandis]
MTETNLEEFPDRVAEWYKDKTILITGGTGFMGKVLIEKLLRSCGDVKKIILLVRSKKAKHPKDRIKDIFANPLFDQVKEMKGEEIIKKVVPVVGDVMLPNLGIQKEDREMLANEVDLIFHCAATIRFDECLKTAVLLNARGTKFMLELAKECKHLKCFIHVSTAYCHLNERILYEKPYPPPADPHKVIKTIEWLQDDVLESITPKILGDIPNTYAFTKALGEALVVEQKEHLPVLILRPSVVIPIWKEPIPGWTDNINGPTGLLIGAGKGVIRTMYCQQDSYADYLPVDIAVNATLISTWYSNTLNKDKWIYNLTSSAEYKVTMEEIITIGRNIIETRIPLNGVAWYPGGSMKRSKIVHLICFFFFHLVPAVLVDILLTILGYKPVLCRVQKRIWKGFEVFEYYANNQWDFDNVESLKARDQLNPREREIYKCDGDGINYHDYFTDCVHAARLYILKETDDTLPAARRHMKVMWVLDKFCKGLFIAAVLYYLYQRVFSPILKSLY